ncbi:hypothetical protein AB0903_17350 [Streptomyces sp. NPDC048389]|uniref:hypothetical protein n=1 Tax=Streptomyces sp. NPDC048389 TaxID=3154622 RepID=UPI003455FB28
MDLEKPPQPTAPPRHGVDVAPQGYEPGDGCLAQAVRIPVRVVVVLVVIPVRMVWDVLVLCGRAVDRVLLRPLGRLLAWVFEEVVTPVGLAVARLAGLVCKVLFYWPWVGLWRYVVVPVVRYGLVVPAVWAYRQLLTPLGHGVARVVRGLWWGAVRLVGVLLVAPVVWVYRYVLAPVGREVAAAVGVAWRIAGFVSRAVGRGLKWLVWNLVGRPARWFYREVCTPVGHFVRDAVWRPVAEAAVQAGRAARAAVATARETVRQARRDAWRALIGTPRRSRSPVGTTGQARNLGGRQHAQPVPGVAAEPEISLRKQG